MVGVMRVSELSGINRVTVWRFLAGRVRPRAVHLHSYSSIALAHTRALGAVARPEDSRDLHECLAAFIALNSRPGSLTEMTIPTGLSP